jgi:hypothetical protein
LVKKERPTTKDHKLMVLPSSKTFILFLNFHCWGGKVLDVIMGSREIINYRDWYAWQGGGNEGWVWIQPFVVLLSIL